MKRFKMNEHLKTYSETGSWNHLFKYEHWFNKMLNKLTTCLSLLKYYIGDYQKWLSFWYMKILFQFHMIKTVCQLLICQFVIMWKYYVMFHICKIWSWCAHLIMKTSYYESITLKTHGMISTFIFKWLWFVS